jgi:hypothetical protein
MARGNPINAFNRILLLVLGALALAGGVIALLVVTPVIHPADVSPGGFLQDFWQGIANLSGGAATTAVILSILVALAGLALIILELIPGRSEAPHYVVRKGELGAVTVAHKSVRQLAQHEAAQIPGVREVRTDVRNGSDGIHITAHASLAPDTVASTVGEQLQANIQEAVQRHIGQPIAEVRVHTQVAPLDTKRRVR